MVVKNYRFFLLGFVFVVGVLLSSGIAVADFADCWAMTGDEDACGLNPDCQWKTNVTDPWCDNPIGCCMDIGCWDYDGTNSTICEANDGEMNCTWDPYFQMYYPNGTAGDMGGCMQDWSGDEVWGGMTEGCWNYDGDKAACGINSCNWKPNGANENSWCGIKSLTDAQMKNPSAILDDIGCCEQTGCWSYDDNETTCNAVFNGMCFYENSSYGGGWCMAKMCSDAGTNETKCNSLKNDLYMPCTYNLSGDNECESLGGGGFGAFDDNTDTCFENGGWYNSSGACVMPSGGFGAGGGGFMFGGGAHCWFADNQEKVCGNITGCVYCESSGVNATTNTSTDNICANKQVGYCEGHDSGDVNTYAYANNTANLACTDIQLKSACKYGPLPNCKWDNTTVSVGGYCKAGTTSDKKAEPPVPFCEHPDSKNNYSLCMQLISDFMMPCTWDNSSTIVKNCTFNPGAVFGSGGETDLGGIGSKSSCTSAGGTWQTENYIEDDILKQDSWCEMTGLLDIDDGGGEGNKGNCDTSCWACEFQSNGTAWATQALAEEECVGSALGYCKWTNDTTDSSFNKLGWCDYPTEMEVGGSGDCNTNCEDCDFMNEPYSACVGSVAACQWVNESGGTSGYCVDKAKKVCSNDCFSCYSVGDCQNSAINCSWDSVDNLCSPDGYSGEICFNGKDDDSDGMIDCSDPDCGFDNFCGGAVFGGDCFAQGNESACNSTVAFGGWNCSWINDTWNPEGWCDMPGANCWKYDNDLDTCNQTAGCTNITSGMGGGGFCDINMTQADDASCWQYSGYNDCVAAIDGGNNCAWKNDTWCAGDGAGTDWCNENLGAGWCDYKPFADCMDLNESSCSAVDNNCTWQTDEYSMQGGWCDVACFNWSIVDSGQCEATGTGGLCEYRDMSATCQPETFMMMGMGAGGKTGCWQYDGNETGCNIKNITCQYKNDTYAHNNLSESEPSGWCMDKAEFQQFGNMQGGVVELAIDFGNPFNESSGIPGAEPGVSGEIDLMGMGMRVSDEGFNFGAGVFNMSNSIICNGYKVGAKMDSTGMENEGTTGIGNASGKFYWYLDTDGNSSGGCTAYGGADDGAGYDFMVSYVARNTTNGVVETKQLMRCASGTWTATNALVTTSKKMSCGEIGGVMIALNKQDLESFSEYNKTADMRIFMASANDTDDRTSPSDYLGPGYYTKGMIDFGFVDCSNPNTKDPKCKNMQKFGFNVFEECMNGVDDDENGLVDCADPMCLFSPNCVSAGNAFAFAAVDGDKTAPTVMFSKVEKLSDAAFMKIDTNEPSSLNVTFYGNDSTCTIANKTLSDTGSESYQAYAKFKPFHSIDLTDDSNSLGYALINGTAYYYKVKVCDPSDNCAVSACSNFTTKASSVAKQFIFKLDLPDGYTVDIPALNKTGYNFTETFNISGVSTTFDVGIKTNSSVTKNMNFTVHSNCGSGLSIGFYGVNIFEPLKIDMTNAFVCDEATNMMGMNSSLKKWNTLIDDMHLGGASDYIQMNVPVAYSATNTFNYVDDAGENPKDVDNYVNCSAGSGAGTTACKVPVSLGF